MQLVGFGGAMMQVATTQIIKVYFPGRQFAPFGVLCITNNAAAMAYPIIFKSVMDAFNWHHGFIALGMLLYYESWTWSNNWHVHVGFHDLGKWFSALASLLPVNLLCGMTYMEPSKEVANQYRIVGNSSLPRPRIRLLLPPLTPSKARNKKMIRVHCEAQPHLQVWY